MNLADFYIRNYFFFAISIVSLLSLSLRIREAYFNESALPSFFNLLNLNNDFAIFRIYIAL